MSNTGNIIMPAELKLATPLPISKGGFSLTLPIPEKSILHEGQMSLHPVSKKEKVSGKLSSVNGTLKKNSPTTGTWVCADLEANRIIQGIFINIKDKHIRVKVLYNNVWIPLMPLDTFYITNNSQKINFTPVMASQLLIECIKSSEKTDGIWEPDTLTIKDNDLVIYTLALAYDLEIGIADEFPFYTKPGIFQADDNEPVIDIKTAVNDYLKKSENPVVTLYIRSKSLAKIIINDFTVKATEIPDNMQPEKNGSVINREKVILAPKTTKAIYAQLCNERFSAAQSFQPLQEGKMLTRIDLYVRLLKFPLEIILAIFPDLQGMPDCQPFPDTEKDLIIEKNESISFLPDWLSFPIPCPCKLDKKWWLVVQLGKGEMHWWVNQKSQANQPDFLGMSLFRINERTWEEQLINPWDQEQKYWNISRVLVKEEL